MEREKVPRSAILVAFTAFNPGFEFQRQVLQAASDCEHVLVIDDSSTEGLLAFGQHDWIPNNVTLLRKAENSGIANSVNLALQHAITCRSEYLMFFDQDTEVHNGLILTSLESVIRYQAANSGMLGCLGAGVVQGRPYSSRSEADIYRVPEVIQSGSVFVTSALDYIGGANESLVIDAVDTDVCLRLRQAGFHVVVDRSISISHPVGSGKAVRILGHSVLITGHNALRRYYMTRNRLVILLDARWWELDPLWCLVYLRRFLVSSLIAVSLEGSRIAKVKAIAYGVIDGFRGRLGKRSASDFRLHVERM